MQSTLSMKDADPHDIFAIEPSFTPPRSDSAAPSLAPASTGSPEHREPHFGPSTAPPIASVPPVTPMPSVTPVPSATPMYRATATDDIRLDDALLDRAPPTPNRWAIRAFWFAFAIISAMGAAAWQHYGDRAKQLVAELTPQVALLSSLIPGKATPAAEQAAPAAQTATADQPAAGAAPAAPSQAAPAAPSQDVATAAPVPTAAAAPTAAVAPPAPTVPAVAPDQTQLLQSMARDLASMGQQIEQLKANIAQLKASQDQLAQRTARMTETRAVEQRPVPPRPRATVSPHAAIVPPVRRPTHAYIPPPPPVSAGRASVAPLPAVTAPAPQAAAPMPLQSPPQSAVVDADDDGPVVRPPMPVR
jgi:Meckel syndrome type 1 protein